MTEAANDYFLSEEAVRWLKGAVGLPYDLRREVLRKAASEHGRDEVIDWFAQFIGMANSVVANNRDAIEIFQILPGEAHPDRAGNINLPTIFGALMGADLARKSKAKGRCEGCALRIGTLANQSPSTTCDVEYVLGDYEEAFWCHENLNEQGLPTRKCPGWAEVKREIEIAEAKRHAAPQQEGGG